MCLRLRCNELTDSDLCEVACAGWGRGGGEVAADQGGLEEKLTVTEREV